METEGICVCGGDLNLGINHNLDTTSKKKTKNHLTKLLNTFCEELGLVDIWRNLHPLERDYTHYSVPHSVHSRIDYFFTQKGDYYRVTDSKIGVADVSEHNAVYLTIQIDSKKKDTVWRLNVGILNDKTTLMTLNLKLRDF